MPVGAGWCRSVPVGAGWCRLVPVGAGAGVEIPVPVPTDRCLCRPTCAGADRPVPVPCRCRAKITRTTVCTFNRKFDSLFKKLKFIFFFIRFMDLSHSNKDSVMNMEFKIGLQVKIF